MNAVDDATRKIDSYVTKVKHLPEVEAGYMTLGDWIDAIVDEAKEDMREELRAEVEEEISEEVTEKVSKEITEKNIQIIVEMLQEYNATKENAVIKLQTKYPDYADQAGELVDKYWK